jgi:hypothetical protein
MKKRIIRITIEYQGKKTGYYSYSVFAHCPINGKKLIGGNNKENIPKGKKKEIEDRFILNSGFKRENLEFIYPE